MKFAIVIMCLAMLVAAHPLQADESFTRVGTSGAWSIFQDPPPCTDTITSIDCSPRPKVCWVASKPAESRTLSETTGIERGQVLLFVSVFPNREGQIAPEVSWMAGLELAEGNLPLVQIGKQSYGLRADRGQMAWAIDQQENFEILSAMRDTRGSGGKLKITAETAEGITVIETFSLWGFTDALAHARELCAQ